MSLFIFNLVSHSIHAIGCSASEHLRNSIQNPFSRKLWESQVGPLKGEASLAEEEVMCLVSCPVLSFHGRKQASGLCMTKTYWLFSFLYLSFPQFGSWWGVRDYRFECSSGLYILKENQLSIPPHLIPGCPTVDLSPHFKQNNVQYRPRIHVHIWCTVDIWPNSFPIFLSVFIFRLSLFLSKFYLYIHLINKGVNVCFYIYCCCQHFKFPHWGIKTENILTYLGASAPNALNLLSTLDVLSLTNVK